MLYELWYSDDEGNGQTVILTNQKEYTQKEFSELIQNVRKEEELKKNEIELIADELEQYGFQRPVKISYGWEIP